MLLTSALCAQQENNTKDTVGTENKQNFTLRSILTLHNINTIEVRESFFTDFSSFPELNSLAAKFNKGTEPDIKNIQADLLLNFRQSMKWKADYSLGVFGQVLGTVMSAAAVGIGVYSVAKYGKDYFNSKKRKK